MKVIDFLTNIDRYNAVVQVLNVKEFLVGEIIYGDVLTDYDDIDLLNSKIEYIKAEKIDKVDFYVIYVK